jgi:hypothetical protein
MQTVKFFPLQGAITANASARKRVIMSFQNLSNQMAREETSRLHLGKTKILPMRIGSAGINKRTET